MGEWISGSKKRPDKDGYYLWINGNHLPFVGMYYFSRGLFDLDGEPCSATHWMELPKAPNE